MTRADIPEVLALDRLSFAQPWSARAYHYEVCESDHSHMLILEEGTPGRGAGERWPGWGRWRRQGRRAPYRRLTGYGGLWVIEEEGHISTLAVQPWARGRRRGELLLTALIQRALNAGAQYIVLEVRVSNRSACALYQKYDFRVVGRRLRYYADHEDAHTMRLDFAGANKTRFHERRAALWQHFHERAGLRDEYTATPSFLLSARRR